MTIAVTGAMRAAGVARLEELQGHVSDAELVTEIYTAMQERYLALPQPLSREAALAEIASKPHA